MDRAYASSSAHTLDDQVADDAQKSIPLPRATASGASEDKHTSTATQYYPPSTPHLNSNHLLILSHQSRGRGVYASRPLAAGTVVEISPVLIFGKEEWEDHGSKTILDCYTFKWGRMGEMALALGLGEYSRLNQERSLRAVKELTASRKCCRLSLQSLSIAFCCIQARSSLAFHSLHARTRRGSGGRAMHLIWSLGSAI